MLSTLCDEILMGSMQLESAAIVKTGKEIRVMAKAPSFRVRALHISLFVSVSLLNISISFVYRAFAWSLRQ